MNKTFSLTLTEQEMNILWEAINNCTLKGAAAPHLVQIMAKMQQAVQAAAQASPAQSPAPEVKDAEVVNE